MNIGFYGGGSICILGRASDVVAFFKCLQTYVVEAHPGKDYTLLMDRLYRRYLRLDQLDSASELMADAQAAFRQVHSSQVDWAKLGRNASQTKLDLARPNLAEVFSKYFEHFAHCVESAKLSVPVRYRPVMTVVAEIPEFFVYEDRPLQEYDKLIGKPFWLGSSA